MWRDKSSQAVSMARAGVLRHALSFALNKAQGNLPELHHD
jgi:hypothetical protein